MVNLSKQILAEKNVEIALSNLLLIRFQGSGHNL